MVTAPVINQDSAEDDDSEVGQDAEAVSDQGDEEPEAPEAPTPPEPPKASGAVDEAHKLIGQYTGGDGEETEVGKAIRTIKRTKQDLRRAEREMATLNAPGAGDETGAGETETKDVLEARINQLKTLEDDAKKTLEKLGYKVVPKDEPTTEQEAIAFLKSKGYDIESDKIEKKELDGILEKAKAEWEKGHNSEQEKNIEAQKLQALEHIVVAGIDRVMAPLDLVIADRLGIDPKDIIAARAGAGRSNGASPQSAEEKQARVKKVMQSFRQSQQPAAPSAQVVAREAGYPADEKAPKDETDQFVEDYPGQRAIETPAPEKPAKPKADEAKKEA